MPNLMSEKNKKTVNEMVQNILSESESLGQIKPPQNSEAMEEAAKKIERLRGRGLFFNYVGTGKGQGPYTEVLDGSVKIDLINGIGIHVLGHSHPNVLEASLSAATSDIVMQGNLQPNTEYINLMEKLVELASRKSKLNHVWLSPSGAMSNENGLKICRQKTGGRMVIAFNKAFAGRTTMMAEITDNDAYREGLPRYEDVLRIPYYDAKNPNSAQETLTAFKNHVQEHKGNICCFMFEPMQGEGGFRVAPREFFIPLLEICKKEGIPVFLDEVQTFCRTGNFFAYETLNLGEYVDVATIAKTLQNGATLYTEDMNPKPGLISGTFAGSSVALAAGLAVLNTLDNGYMGTGAKVEQLYKKFTGMLQDLSATTCKGLLGDVEGMGLMIAFTPLAGEKKNMMDFVKKAFANGLICFGCGSGPYRVRFLLPAILEDKHIAEIKQVLEKTLHEIK